MNDKRLVGVLIVVAIITGVFIGSVMNAPSTDARDNNTDGNTVLLGGCSVKVVGSFQSVDVFNEYDDSSGLSGYYYGTVLTHCVCVDEKNVDKSFTAVKGRIDTGYKFVFQFVSYYGFTSSETFYASSGNVYTLTYWIRNGAGGAATITITLSMA